MPINPTYFRADSTIAAQDRFDQHAEDRRDGRNDFAIDRDRVLYSKAFRSLSDKTQVFLSDEIRDLRTRLTHTLEVNQLGKTIVSSLGCNVDLTEAIALGHDVGHTPFGHVGERMLSLIMNNCEQLGIEVNNGNRGFKHNLQSLRVLCDLDEHLNLSKYTLWGIVNHSKLQYKTCTRIKNICYTIHHPGQCPHKPAATRGILSCDFYDKYLRKIEDKYWTIEGIVVGVADEIAQRHHDIEDSIRFHIIDRQQLLNSLAPFEPLYNDFLRGLKAELDAAINEPDDIFLSKFSRLIVKSYVMNLTTETKRFISEKGDEMGITNHDDFIRQKHLISVTEAKHLVSFTPEFENADKEMQKFLMKNVLNSYSAQTMDGKGAYIIRKLFDAYLSNPTQLSDNAIRNFYKMANIPIADIGDMRGKINDYRNTDPRRNMLMRTIADYIGSMTDSYAYDQFDMLYGTKITMR